jgi:hypothetical protein
MKYKAILFHPEGDYVTDFRSATINEVWEKLADMGSRWVFYPIAFVATDKTIVDTPPGLEFLKRKRIHTAQHYLSCLWHVKADEICDLINMGAPLSFIYCK